MKKNLLTVALAFAAIFGFTSCGEPSKPEEVAEKIINSMKDGDWKEMLDLAYFDERMSDQDIEDAKKIALPVLEIKGNKELKDKEGIDNYEIKDVEYNKDKDRATVEVKIKYGDGSSLTQRFVIKKNEEGKWKWRM